MDEPTRRILSRYLIDVRSLPNESAKSHRFAGLISDLFPGTRAPTEFAAGIEKLVRIDTKEGTKRRWIDAYYGDAVIEFENSLKKTEAEARRQLREYVCGEWRDGDRRPLVCVASDGLTWKSFRPRIKVDERKAVRRLRVAQPAANLAASDIELVPLREIVLSEKTLDDFWIWLTNLLFRERTVPTAERFRIGFGVASLAFSEAMEALRAAWKMSGDESEVRLAFDTWKRYLTLTYGSLTGVSGSRPELETLFLKHTYLASIARLLVWAALSGGRTKKSLRDVADDVLSGLYFHGEGIENLVEDDFFQWIRHVDVSGVLAPVWERTLAQITTYDLSRLDQDVLKGVYQELVDPTDRHDLAEYYTPEWLCERIVAELLPDEGFVSTIDPACGSGSFLRAVIAHLLRGNPGGGPATRLRAVLDNVVGIDIHPLAVTISRATYTLALGPLVKATKRPIQVPVYLADSLFLPTEVTQYVIGEEPSYEITFGGCRVRMAEKLVDSAELFDPAITASVRVAVSHAEKKDESLEDLKAYLKKAVPALAKRRDFDALAPGLWSFTEELARLIRSKRNSIWAFIIRNGYRPAMLKNRFDFVIGNPPWLSYRYIADPEYQREVKKRAVDEYRIAPREQRLMTQMELATVFLVHTLKTFGRDGARIGFVMPRSLLTADQHANLRQRNYRAPVSIEGYWDLWRVAPVFNVPSCVVFAERREPQRALASYELPMVEWSGRLPERDLSWSEAEDYLEATQRTAQLIFLASRSALSTSPGRSRPSRGSPYGKRFRQGATIVPRNLYFVAVRDLDRSKSVEPERLYWAETEPEQAELAKAPYRDVRMEGPVEGRFIYLTALSENLLPFALVNPKPVVLPLEWSNRKLRVRTAEFLRASGDREMAKWMSEAERIWKEKRGRKAKLQSVYERLDYQRELTVQNLSQRHLVFYNAAGSNLSATRIDRRALLAPFVIEHKLYWAHCQTIREADYLTATLNSTVVNEAIKPFQSTGLMGERDIEKKVLDLPIPLFRAEDTSHGLLSDLGAQAKAQGDELLGSVELPKSLGRRRGLLREHLAGTLAEIDDAVRTLLAE